MVLSHTFRNSWSKVLQHMSCSFLNTVVAAMRLSRTLYPKNAITTELVLGEHLTEGQTQHHPVQLRNLICRKIEKSLGFRDVFCFFCVCVCVWGGGGGGGGVGIMRGESDK